MTRGLQQVLQVISKVVYLERPEQHTLDLLESLTMQLADCAMLLSKENKTAVQWISDTKVIMVEAVLAIGFLVHQGLLHLLNRIDKLMRLLCHVILLTRGKRPVRIWFKHSLFRQTKMRITYSSTSFR